MIRRAWLCWLFVLGVATLVGRADDHAKTPKTERALANGIVLPEVWPPQPKELSADPVTPPYLVHPPEVISIDLGRQLFVDDFLIAKTDLTRTYHRAKYHPKSPVLKPDKPWEDSIAMPFSDGVWYDPADKLFKIWYMGGRAHATCYATSRDGIAWEKPALDVRPGTNIVQEGQRDSSTVWLDLRETNPARRYKMFRSGPGGSTVPKAFGLATYFSPDGIHWTEKPRLTGSCGDRSTVFYNPFRSVWVYSLRHGWGEPRRRRYWESPDVAEGPMWEAITQPSWWAAADSADLPREDLKIKPQLYNLDAVAYESLLVGLFTIWKGQPATRQKPNEVYLGFSRDGWHFSRPDRRPFCPVSEKFGDWNYANVQSAGGGFLVVGDELFFYVSGRGGAQGTSAEGQCVTGLATLRRDGFASLDAGEKSGSITTRPVRFRGKHLFVNLAAAAGELKAEILDESGRPIAPYTLANCAAVKADSTKARVAWQGAEDLAPLADKTLQIRFELTNGSLYSFWVAADREGHSQGYLGAGGPGFTGPTDAPAGRP